MTAPAPSTAKVLVWVQHLLGVGHLYRTARIVRAALAQGLDVTVAHGGVLPPDLDFGGARLAALPAARVADATFSRILDAAGRPVDDAWRTRRAAAFAALYDEVRPGVLMTELFPFGRRAFAFELDPVVAAARRDGAAVVASVRDIVEPPRLAARVDETIARLRAGFDVVLVHADPAFMGLEASFPRADEIADMLVTTGLVAPTSASPAPDGEGDDEVIVSGGGGAFAAPLLHAAMAARDRTRLAGHVWRLVAGHSMQESEFEALRGAAAPGVIVERARPDLARMLHRARLSVSRAGYNTVVETLAAGCPAVLVPWAAGREREQTLRARRLGELGRAECVETAETIDPAALAAAIDRAAAVRRFPAADFDLGGADASAAALCRLVRCSGSRGGGDGPAAEPADLC